MAKELARVLHVGAPTARPDEIRSFFAKHPETLHLGRGAEHGTGGWIDDELAALMEADLRASATHAYDVNRARAIVGRHFDSAQTIKNLRAVTLSCEDMVFRGHADTDAFIKASRLFDLFGYGAKIVLVLRNQFDVVRSLYFTAVRRGLAQYFGEYLEWFYACRFASGAEDLFYDDVINIYGDLFGYENILIVLAENIATNPPLELYRLCDFANLSVVGYENAPPGPEDDLQQLDVQLKANRDRARLDGGPFALVDLDRYRSYWKLAGYEAPPAFAKRPLSKSITLRPVTHDTPIFAEYDAKSVERFIALFGAHNSRVASMWARHDMAGYGYPMV